MATLFFLDSGLLLNPCAVGPGIGLHFAPDWALTPPARLHAAPWNRSPPEAGLLFFLDQRFHLYVKSTWGHFSITSFAPLLAPGSGASVHLDLALGRAVL
ncbi:hypothetical protein CAURIC_11140 [Corynebacterium auriscanis]|nr:hypothetical protein HMPREF3098_05910 [Corynebacterium sp. HMSC28B08]WJY73816.1 hypothetical protein CAURIC_11140 [Corynebacterium auriscanis]